MKYLQSVYFFIENVKAKFVNYLLEQKGYTQLPKQIKEYSGTKVYCGVHRSIDGKKSADEIEM